MASLADWIKSQTSDYGQLFNNNPRMDNYSSVLQQGLGQLIPSNADFKSPEAMRDWGTAAALNAPMGVAIKALHASPHSFDKFDISKIGTGEGAQSYGHGLYLAENPKTIEQYLVNGESQLTPQGSATSQIKAYQNNYDDALNGAKNRLNYMQYHSPENIALQKDTIKALENKDFGGHVYESSIQWPNVKREAVDPLGEHHLLDWDKSLNNQSDYIKNTLNSYKELGGINNINDSMTGKDIYNSLVSKQAKENNLTPMDVQKATKKGSELADWIGIPGIKYLDQGSRDAGSGTSNYVMFSDKYPNITKRSNKLSDYFEGYGNPPSIKNPNLNAGLLNKHLSGQKLTPKEMAQYEANGSAMETPQLQRYNLGNANAQGGSTESRSNLLHDSYHGTRESTRHDGTTSSAIDGFDLNKGGWGSGNRDGKLGVFSTNNPFVASEFAEKRNNPFVMPLKIRMDNPWQPENYREISDLIDNHTQFKDSYKFPDGSNIRMVDDAINPEAARKELTDKGFDSVYLKNTTMDSIDKKPINQYVSLDPKNIRSRFAAFDPLRKNSSSLLASLLGGTALVGQYNKEKKMKEMR